MNLWRGNPSCGRRRDLLLVALAFAAWFGARVHGQQAPGAAPNQVEADPIQCWWKTDKNAVRVGEPLTLTLTCGVIDTDSVRVTVDPARLDPAVLDMSPFEVLDGSRQRDISSPPRLYFQYSYTLRLIGDGFFGRDVDVPGLPLTYRVQSSGGDAARGRDQVYLLPALPVRVLSLVPVTATDIRDASPETFADLESRSWRATREFAAAGILFACAVVLIGVAAVRTFGRSREREPGTPVLLPGGTILHACEREARRVKAEAAAGWTPALIGRALTAFRIAGAVALGRPVAQTRVDRREQPREGQLALENGLWRPQRLLASASTTADAITRWLANEGQHSDARVREALTDMAVPLRVFGAAHFSRSGALDPEALDAALDQGMRGLDRLRRATPWAVRATHVLARTASAVREATWAR